jgi:predicted transcriptional regulator
MVLNLTPEQEARVTRLADQSGKTLSDVMTDTALWLLNLEQAHDASLERSLEQANRGEFIDEEEMDRRFAGMIRPR